MDEKTGAISGVTEAALAVLLAGAPAQPPSLSGSLMKQASNWVSGFQLRHFRVGEGRARYWHSLSDADAGKPPQAEYSLLAVEVEVDEKCDHTFKVLFASQSRSPYVLSTDGVVADTPETPLTREDWISALNQNSAYAKRKAAYDRAAKMITCVETEVAEMGKRQEEAIIEDSCDVKDGKKSLKFASFLDIQEFVVASFVSDDPNESFALPCASEEMSGEIEKAIITLAHGPPIEPPALSGPMMKLAQGRLCGLQLRYVEVSNGRVKYWHSLKDFQSGNPPKADYHLVSAQFLVKGPSQIDVTVLQNNDRSYVFDAQVGSSTEGSHTREEWLEALEAHEAYARKMVYYAWASRVGDC